MSDIRLFDPQELMKRLQDPKEPEPTVEVGTKVCSKCKVVKPFSDFHRNNSVKSGYNSSCKACKKGSRGTGISRLTSARHPVVQNDQQLMQLINSAISEGGAVIIRRHGLEYSIRRY